MFLPWKSLTKVSIAAILTQPNLKGYSIAAGLHKMFKDLKSGIRAILSSNVHVCLGENGDQPLSMLIVYTECGTRLLLAKYWL